MKVILLILGYAAMVAVDVPALVREKSWGELTAFSALTALSFVICLLLTLGVRVPNPVVLLDKVSDALLRMFM